ncbi:MAG TPA: hypothetical protein VGO89_21115, partial [Streptomyces sp.]|nr:hypothetical protein [Streptomyces sp.]
MSALSAKTRRIPRREPGAWWRATGEQRDIVRGGLRAEDRLKVPSDANAAPGMAHKPENRRQAVIKLLWIGIWMAYLSAPVADLFDGGHSRFAVTLAALGLVAFVGLYLVLVFRTTGTTEPSRVVYGALAVMLPLAVILAVTLGPAWLVLFVYLSVASGAVLPPRQTRWAIPVTVGVLVALGLRIDTATDLWPALVIPALLGGFAMAGVRQMVRTTRELREARAVVAHLAASEERL